MSGAFRRRRVKAGRRTQWPAGTQKLGLALCPIAELSRQGCQGATSIPTIKVAPGEVWLAVSGRALHA